ncbi:MAG TPA: hypothetical protein VK162_02435 [Streptosporangiaceae bacterium]|nr:hypothetical protein [Streptosporangiaceae bacterium]
MPGTSDQWTALDRQYERLVDAGCPPALAVPLAGQEADPQSPEAGHSDPQSPEAAFAAGATFKRFMPGTNQSAAVFEFRR